MFKLGGIVALVVICFLGASHITAQVGTTTISPNEIRAAAAPAIESGNYNDCNCQCISLGYIDQQGQRHGNCES